MTIKGENIQCAGYFLFFSFGALPVHGVPGIFLSTDVEARVKDDVSLWGLTRSPLGLVVVVLQVGRGVGT